MRLAILQWSRFTDLRAGIPNASPNVISQRLREIEQAGVVRHRKLPPPAGSWIYELTDWGLELEPVIIQLGRWGIRSPAMPRNAEFSVDALILLLRTMFDPEAAKGFCARFELRIGEDRFSAVVDAGRIELTRGSRVQPDAIIETDVGTMDALLWAGGQLADARRAGI